ncbi:MAG TPA: TfuA-like protein [Polyangiaceae bacterium]|nr:TfuA-like protein [Polyangiaceae bacterium]
MSDVYVFLGPTLSVDLAREHLDAHYLPPVSRGDVYRVARQKPWGIGIVDGYFSQAPAVWHKEILWAMKQGIHVFGAASMGALRAAELATFGMCGVGRIFEAFRDGVYEDDDEVTVIHGPKESGYLLVSEPMANIRATLQRALDERIIGSATEQRLVSVAKALHYPERNYSKLLATAQRHGEDDGDLERLKRWLPEHKVNQKRLDALEMLDLMRELQEREPEPLRVSFRFERTDAWEEMVRQCAQPSSASEGAELPTELILDELRLLGGPALRAALVGALARHLAAERARAHGATVTRELFSDTLNSFFAERGVRTPEQIKSWLEEHELDPAGLTGFMQQQSFVRWAMVMFAGETERQLRDHLRSTPDYVRVVRRANAKQLTLARSSSTVQRVHELPTEQLVTWFFESRLTEAVPSDLDACAWERGFPDRHALIEALRREYYFVTSLEVAEPEQMPAR